MTKFATIVSANYLAYAITLSNSLRRYGYDNLQVLLVDRVTEETKAACRDSGLSVRFAEDLAINDFDRIAYKYDLVELNTALKPTFLKALFSEGADQVIYLDPDIQVFNYLTPVLEALKQAQIVLTPHSLKPVMDGLRPSDVDYLRTGSFNLGFVALSKGDDALALLDWWESRCLSMGFNDIAFGTFVDQKWMDLAPCYFSSVSILRHPGCNVAYWNLHERKLSEDKGEVIVNGQPLIFFHFSGVNANAPQILSRHQTRHSVVDGSILQRLVTAYCEQLLAGGHRRYSKIQYTFRYLNDGTLITPTMRRALLAFNQKEEQPFSPYSPFQVMLRKTGIAVPSNKNLSSNSNTLNFKKSSWRVRGCNQIISLLAKILGAERVLLLLKYAALLTRENHFACILLDRELDFIHKLRR